MELRTNQLHPVSLGIDYFKSPNEPALIVAPVAFGKSVVIAKVTESISDRVIIVQPSMELLKQNYRKYISLGGYAGIFSASMNRKEVKQVVFATIGSLHEHGEAFKDCGFTKIIIDECDKYPRGIDSMMRNFITNCSITHCLGLTATPFKLTLHRDYGSYLVMLTNMGDFFKYIIHVTQIQDMGEYWSNITYEEHEVDTDFLKYVPYDDDMGQKMFWENNLIHTKLVKRLNNLERKHILAFVPNVSNAKQLVHAVADSACVYGAMPTKARNEVIRRFNEGRIRCLFNVNVLSVGYDNPIIDCVATARPTQSLSLFYQQQGRGIRIHPDKKDCLMLDFSGNLKKFGYITDLNYKRDWNNNWQLYSKERLLTGVQL